MPEDSGGEPLPPDPAARSPAARSPEAGSPEARSPEAPSPGSPIPESLFPRALPVLPRLRVSACRQPAAGGPGTEGDWLDVLALPGGVIALVLARAHGPGGLIGPAAVRLRAVLRALLRGGAAPAEALDRLAAAAAGSPAVHRATACVALLTPETGDLRYAAAGQPRPVVCTAAGTNGHLARSAGESPGSGSPGSGSPGPGSPGSGSPGPGAGHREAGTAVLPSGAVLLLYYGPATVPGGDGSPGGDTPPGGDASPEAAARAAATASSLLAGPAPGGPADLADRVGPEVLAALTPGQGAGPAALLAAYRLQAPAGGWSMDLPADPLALRGLRARLRDWLRELGASASDRTDVELAVWEAAVNAIVHGRPVTGPASITVRTVLDETGRAVIQVSDRGRWRPPQPPGTGRRWPGGQGLLVIRQAADELDIDPGPEGTTVTLRRTLSHPLPGQAQPAEYPATAARHGRPA
jgi:anti-sigma regulatory factor (Ser/Thr protein kinase)